MELKECITCGSHSFTDKKCDYCGNEYEVAELYAYDNKVKTMYGISNYAPLSAYMKSLPDEEIDGILNNLKDGLTPNQIRTATCKEDLVKPEVTELSFDHGNTRGDKILRVMSYLLLSIIWFAVCVFIPPLFLITICGLIIWVCRKICKKY